MSVSIALSLALAWLVAGEALRRGQRESLTRDAEPSDPRQRPGFDTSETRYELVWDAPLRSGLGNHLSLTPLPGFDPLTGNKIVDAGPMRYHGLHLVQADGRTPVADADLGWEARVYDIARYGMPGWSLPLDVLLDEDADGVVIYDGDRTPVVYDRVGSEYASEFSTGARLAGVAGGGFVLTYGSGVQLHFAPFAGADPISHLLIRVRDKYGNRTELERDATGRILRMAIVRVGADPASLPPAQVTLFEYEAGLLRRIVRAGAPTIELHHDDDDYLTSIVSLPISGAIVGEAFTRTLDLYYVEAGDLAPPDGNAYPRSLRAIEGPFAGDRAALASVPVSTYHFDQAGHYAQTIASNNRGMVVHYTADAKVRMYGSWPSDSSSLRDELADSYVEISGAGPDAAVAAMVDRRGLRTSYVRDEVTHRVEEIVRPDGSTTRFEYADAGYPSSETDPSHRLETERDDLGRVIRQTAKDLSGETLAELRFEYFADTDPPDFRFGMPENIYDVRRGRMLMTHVTAEIDAGIRRFLFTTGGSTRTLELHADGTFRSGLDEYGYGHGIRPDATGYGSVLVTPGGDLATGRTEVAPSGDLVRLLDGAGIPVDLRVDGQGHIAGSDTPAAVTRVQRDPASSRVIETELDNRVRALGQGDRTERFTVDGCGRGEESFVTGPTGRERRTMSREEPFACAATYERRCERPENDEGRPAPVNLGGIRQVWDWCDNPRALGGCGWQVAESCEYSWPDDSCRLFPDPFFCRQPGV